MNNRSLFHKLCPLTNKLVGLILLGIFLIPWVAQAQSTQEQLSDTFQKQIAPWIERNCTSCHNEENRESGIRVDNLDDSLPDSSIRLWQAILDQVSEGKMPPEDQPQPTPEQRRVFTQWLTEALHAAQTRPTPLNGSMRRLTVPQYDRTLKTLLGIDRNLTETLPPDALSRDGFTNQANTLAINPLQLETYFKIADEALDSALVDPNVPPSIEFFRMDLGKSIHPNPSSEQLILGANNHLLANSDFIVTEPDLTKPFPFERLRLQRKFRFIEGYQGNDTVRAWRDFEGIHHAVFACMRGNEGYPKGKAYELLPNGLALRSAIPSPEIFGESSTYGPQANFKLSLRELPERGKFQVRVTASKANDLMLIEPNANAWIPSTEPSASVAWDKKEGAPGGMKEMVIPQDGIYQVVVHHQQPQSTVVDADSSKLGQGLLGHWTMNPDSIPPPGQQPLQLAGKAHWVESPFDKALSTSGEPDALADSQPTTIGVGAGDFTISAWIHPKKLAQGGIVCLGGYGYTHGWLLDMPDARGILRMETANSNRQHNGTVQSPPGILKKDTWQHVCAVVRRAPQKTELLVNGYQVAVGAIQPADLSNPQSRLHIGRIENAQGFDGLIDEVRIYNRALDHAEVLALVEPGKS
ncbi:MAG: LamG-like jellyroll fold domain-containing protein, partial [Planctomycetota bacterium]